MRITQGYNGKWRINDGLAVYKTISEAEDAYKAYRYLKYWDHLGRKRR